MNIELTVYDEVFLSYSIKWFRDKELLRLLDAGEVDPEGQRRWFRTLPSKEDYKIWGVLCDGIPIGASGLKHIDTREHVAEYFGYIGDKSMWGKGCGRYILEQTCDKAREIGIAKVVLKVLSDNPRAIRLYEKNGFKASSEEDGLISMWRML